MKHKKTKKNSSKKNNTLKTKRTRKICRDYESNLPNFENDYQLTIKDKIKTKGKKSKKQKYLSKVDKLLDETRIKMFDKQQSGELWKEPFTKLLAIPYSISTITPKNDYYTYINYRWLQNTEITAKATQKYYSQIDNFRVAQENVYHTILDLVKNYCKTHDTKRAKAVKTVYASFTSFDNAKMKVHVSHLKERYESYTKSDNLWGYMAQTNTNEIISWGCPIFWKVQADVKNAKIFQNQIVIPQLSIYDIKIYYDDFGDDPEYTTYSRKIKSSFYEYLNKLFESCLGKNHGLSAPDVFKCEKEILDAMGCTQLKRESPEFYNIVKKDDAMKLYGFNWEQFTKALGFEKTPDTFMCSSLSYLKCICATLKEKWKTKQWKSYWYYIYLRQLIRFNKELRYINFDFNGRVITGVQVDFPGELLPIFGLSLTFNTLLSELYMKGHTNPRLIHYIRTLFADLIIVFKRIITRNDWLSDKTRKYALLKLDHLKLVIADPGNLRPDPLLAYGNDAWENILLMTRWKTKKYIMLEGREVVDMPSIDWTATPFKLTGTQTYVVNAYYTPTLNSIYIPAAYLQKPFIDLDERGMEYNLAHVGYTLGHEMSHSLDAIGGNYDYNGNLYDWWEPKDKAHYKGLQADIIKQYEVFAARDGIQFDASIGIGEDIADISGLAICEEYLKDFQDRNDDIVPIRYLSFEAFFIYYAVQQRQFLYKKALLAQLKTNPHPLDKYRTNVPLSRSKVFRSLYNIKKEDEMFWHLASTIW